MIIIPEDMAKPTGELTHEGKDGVRRPGPVAHGAITKAHIDEADSLNRDFVNAREGNNRYSATSPNLTEPYSPLAELAFKALRRYGDMNPGTIGGETIMMLLEFANLVIEELRAHPYWDGVYMDYYVHPEEIRPIPDAIMIAGLLAHYSVQQMSSKAESYVPAYRRITAQILYNRKYGSGPIELAVMDR